MKINWGKLGLRVFQGFLFAGVVIAVAVGLVAAYDTTDWKQGILAVVLTTVTATMGALALAIIDSNIKEMK